MKNTKKIISLVLAICMLASLAISASAANTVDASGGTGTSSVTLSSTADGSIGGDPAATKMSVTVPTVLPIAVGTDGTVSTATDTKIVNGQFFAGFGGIICTGNLLMAWNGKSPYQSMDFYVPTHHEP